MSSAYSEKTATLLDSLVRKAQHRKVQFAATALVTGIVSIAAGILMLDGIPWLSYLFIAAISGLSFSSLLLISAYGAEEEAAVIRLHNTPL